MKWWKIGIGIVCLIWFLFCIIKLGFQYALLRRHHLLESGILSKRHIYLRPMLDKITKLFHKYGITKWWLDKGSLLGQQRHEGFIPYDHDIDIAVLYNNEVESKWDKIINALKSDSNYVLKEKYLCISLVHKATNTKVDICLMKRDQDRILPKHQRFALYSEWYYRYDQMLPLREVEFEGSYVFIPRDPLPFLYRMYGEDCLTNMKLVHTHTTASDSFWMSFIKEIPMYLTPISK